MEVSGVVGFLILLVDIWAIIRVAKSKTTTLSKFIWILLILFLPVIGLILWYFAGPKG